MRPKTVERESDFLSKVMIIDIIIDHKNFQDVDWLRARQLIWSQKVRKVETECRKLKLSAEIWNLIEFIL